MTEELKIILENGGLPAALIGVVWLMRPVLLAFIESWNAARAFAERRLDTELTQTRELSQALQSVTAQLKINAGMSNQLINKIDALPSRADIQQVGATMRDWASTHDATMHAHDQKLDLVHAQVKAVPSEVWREGKPTLEAISVALQDVITNTEKRIMDQLDPQADNARAAVQQEMRGMVERLEGMERLIKSFQPRAGESGAPVPQEG